MHDSQIASEETTMADPVPPRPTRRALLAGAVAGAGLGAAVLAGCTKPAQKSQAGDKVTATRVDSVPNTPDSPIWATAPSVVITMDGQAMAKPMRPTPSVPEATVRAVHDGKNVGFLVEWSDPQDDDLTIKCDGFRDAVAVLLVGTTTNAAARIMGTKDTPATLLHWKADWQRDVDQGFQDEEVVFPRVAADYHPPLKPGVEPLRHVQIPQDYIDHNATQWLPGYAVGNPLSQPAKVSSVEKLWAMGFGTAHTQPTQDCTGKGVFGDAGWKVAIVKPMTASDENEIALKAGQDYGMAIALWSGMDSDSGGHKSPSKSLLTLHLA